MERIEALIEALLLGILQGLTEFLPISSSAHLLVVPPLLGWTPFGLAFDVLLHAGTFLAIILYFREDIKRLIYSFLKWSRNPVSEPPAACLFLVVGTIPIGLTGLFLEGWIERTFREPTMTAWSLTIFGLVLLLADRQQGRRTSASAGWKEALVIGCAQALALAPGVSRSGVTITAALLLGFSRWESARLSFLLALPAVGLATAVKLLGLLTEPEPALTSGVILVGVVSSFLSGYLCIKYFLIFLRRWPIWPFTLYRVLLSLVIWLYFS